LNTDIYGPAGYRQVKRVQEIIFRGDGEVNPGLHLTDEIAHRTLESFSIPHEELEEATDERGWI